MKSHVTMEQHVCIVCGNTFDTENILLDKQLRAKFETYTLTGNSICEKCQSLLDDNYIALVSVKNIEKRNTLKQEEANRTGELTWIKREVFDQIFDIKAKDLPMMFVEPEVITTVKNLMHEAKENADETDK